MLAELLAGKQEKEKYYENYGKFRIS